MEKRATSKTLQMVQLEPQSRQKHEKQDLGKKAGLYGLTAFFRLCRC